jgi:class 3 adenylate cyclase
MTKSEILLGRLLEERLTPNADLADVDRRIRDLFEEEWAVAVTDMAGSSRHVADHGAIPLLCKLHEFKRVARPIFEQAGGLVVKTEDDSFLVLFRRPPDALGCLVRLQRALAHYNATRAEESRLEMGAGLGFGKVLKIGDTDVYGVESDFASRLGEELAGPSEILVTDAARAALMHSPGVRFQKLDRGASFDAFEVVYDSDGR